MRFGFAVTLLDLGRSAGGRLASRRLATPDGTEWRFDHGAPFFTAMTDEFRLIVGDWSSAGIVAPWLGRFMFLDEIGLAFERAITRWVGVPSMSALPRRLIESAGDRIAVRNSFRAERLELTCDGRFDPSRRSGAVISRESARPLWRIHGTNSRGAAEALGPFSGVILAMPAPQASRVIAASRDHSSVEMLQPLSGELGRLSCRSAWVTMLAFESRVPIDADVISVRTPGVIARAVRESGKPGRRDSGDGSVATEPDRWVVTSTDEWAATRLDDPRERIAVELERAFRQLVRSLARSNGAPAPDAPRTMLAEAHRWSLAMPRRTPAPRRELEDETNDPRAAMTPTLPTAHDGRVIACGDWSAGEGVEAAFLAGRAAARRLSAHLEASYFEEPFVPGVFERRE